MPYVSTDITSAQEDEDQKKKDSAGESSGSPTLSGGTGTEGSAPAGTPNSGAGKPSSSGSWTNLQSYLDANSDKQFGSQVAGKVQGEVDNANKSQQSAEQGFKQNVDQNTVNYDSNLTKQATDDPYAFLQDSNKVSQLSKQRDASYAGPKALADSTDIYNNTNKAVQDAYQDANLYNNASGGNQAILQKLYNRPQYSGGQQNLDSLLIQNDKGARQAFAGVKDQANQSNQNFQNLQNSLQQYAGNAATATQAAHDQTGAALTGALNTTQGTLNNQYQTALTNMQQFTPTINSDLQSGNFNNLTAQQLQAIGLNPGQKFATYNLNLGNYYTPFTPSNLNANTVASKDQVDRLNALSQLNGGQNLMDAGQAGQYSDPNSLYGKFNYDTFAKNAADKAAEFQGVLNDKNFFNHDGGQNAAGLTNLGVNPNGAAAVQASLMDELAADAPWKSYDPNTNAAAGNYQKLMTYLNQLGDQYGANKFFDTGGATPINTNPLLPDFGTDNKNKIIPGGTVTSPTFRQ